MYTLTKNQLVIFRAICQGSMSVNDIVRSTALSSKTAYRISDVLEKERLITSQNDRGVQFVAGSGLHAAALRRYVLSDEYPIDVIVGSELLVLLSISYIPKSIERISTETKLKPETVRVMVWRLRRYGVVTQKGKKLMISPTVHFLIQFLQDFSRGMNVKMMEERTKIGIILWSGGLECIFSSHSVDSPTGVQKTGISAMADHDLQFISRTKYYYYSYWQANLRTEDIAVQNLLISPKSTREISYSILLLQKNGFEPEYLLESARNVGISKQVRGIISFMSGKEVTDPFLPSRTDIEDLYRQYGVQ